MLLARFIIAITLLGIVPSAYAYIDPGSGSFMLQLLLATLIGLGLTIKKYFQYIKSICLKIYGQKRTEDEKKDT